MRTEKQNNILRSLQSPSRQVFDLISSYEIEMLLKYYKTSQNVIKKNTGPKVLYLNEEQPFFKNIVHKLQQEFGHFQVRSAQIFDVTSPHVIHNDDDHIDFMCYKGILVPLEINGDSKNTNFVTYDQYYYGGPAKFFNGENFEGEVYYNQPVCDYSNVENLSNNQIDEGTYKKYFTHLDRKWLQGLSIEKIFPWTIGSAVCFDSTRLHSASDFKAQGITSKIGLSIFTTIPD